MKKFIQSIDKMSFVLPAIMVLVVLTFGIVSPKILGEIFIAVFNWTVKNFSWFFAIGTALLMVFCVWVGVSKYGNVRLGGKDAKPEISLPVWITITFTSGMALGVVFYGVGEPLMNFMNPPDFSGLSGGSLEAAEEALKYVFVHWGFQPYAIYTSCGLGYALVYWNSKRSFELGSALYPLIGEKSSGVIGKLVNCMCLYAMVSTLGTNVGMGTLQLTAGIDYVFDFKYSAIAMQIGVISILAVIWIVAACTGIHKGIKYVSTLHMCAFAVLVAWAFIFGDSIFILNNTITSIGKYISVVLPEALYLEPALKTGWISRWTIFYWAWWLAVAPLTGLFLCKLAKGRTLRQFVLVNMVIPIGFIFIWFGIFGSSAISKQLGGVNLWGEIESFGFPVSLFAYLNTLPCKPVMIALGFVAIFFSFITQAESMTYTMAGMTASNKVATADGEQKSPIFLKVFWGSAIAIMGFVLIQSGGLEAVQISVVMCGLPILVLLLINSVGFIRAILYRDKYDLTLTTEEKELIRKEREANSLQR